jgi:pyruvate dehydrogenase E2 component (dihydrolipoamide acetyltransferase)
MGAPQEVLVPDIGDFKDVQVIEVLVRPGDSVEREQSLVSLESDKATMDIPSPAAGVVREVRVKVGDKVSEGAPILVLEAADAAPPPQPAAAAAAPPPKAPPPLAKEAPAAPASREEERPTAPPRPSPGEREAAAPRAPPVPQSPATEPAGAKPHASPSVRKFARELGVELAWVRGTGPRKRVLQSDVQAYVKAAIARGPAAAIPSPEAGVSALNLPPWPKVDFAKFGPIDLEPLSRIQKISGPALARNWVMIPHVTNNDEADITELEALRVRLNKEHEKNGIKVTMLAFLIKACVGALRKSPRLNSSLDGDHLVLKRYYHIGFAADTPNGLVVPVVKDADQKGVLDIANETGDLSRQAREGKLKPADMQGGTFSISSLGGIGGTSFSPIINAPEVAILGVSRAVTRPVWHGGAFVPRLMLPLSLSYDHRVIDGAVAARFNANVVQLLADFRRVAL